MNFEEDIEKLKKSIIIFAGELNRLSEDNSFHNFIEDFINSLIHDLNLAIKDRENEININEKNINNSLYRYIGTVSRFLNIKIISNDARLIINNINNLIINWINMVEENNLFKNNSKFINIKNDIHKINSILNGSESLEHLIEITNKLINKANNVLIAYPEQFNLSKSLMSLIHDEENK